MNQKKLDETWKNCLAMWKWIAYIVVWRWIARRVRRQGDFAYIASLKEEWVRKHNFPEIYGNCFFCDALVLPRSCLNCPGTKIDPDFNCWTPEYNYHRHPIKFYMKLVSLNRKRKRSRRK